MATKVKKRPAPRLDQVWEITTSDLVTFRAVVRGANPLVAQKRLVAASWSDDDSYDFVQLALTEAKPNG